MKKEKQVRSYKRRTKSGKTVTVKAHTAKYEAADEKAKEVSKKPGAGKELEERKKKPVQLEIPFDKEEEKKVLDEVKETTEKESSKKPAEKKTTVKATRYASGTNGPEPKSKGKRVKDIENLSSDWHNAIPVQVNENTWRPSNFRNDTSGAYDMVSKEAAQRLIDRQVRSINKMTKFTSKRKSEAKVAKTSASKSTTSEPAFTAAEFREWYRGTGSAADKKVAKALRAQLGRSGYRKLEDEAIDNYSSRGHLSMFKKVSGGSSSKATPKQPTTKAMGVKDAAKKFDKIVKEKSTGSKGTKAVKDIENLKSNWAAAKPVQIDKNTWRPSNFRNDTSGAYDMVSKEATERLIASQIKRAGKELEERKKKS